MAKEETGFYKVDGANLIKLQERPGNGSMNGMIQYLGYNLTQVHTITTTGPTSIEVMGVKIFTQELVFVWDSNKNDVLDQNTVNLELNHVDWAFEFRSDVVEDILTEGIDQKTLTFDYLTTVITLVEKNKNLFHSPRLGMYLSFKDGYLESYASDDLTNSASKWVKEANREFFDTMLNEAMKFHDNKVEAMEEVNLQCEALEAIPNALKNKYIPIHKKANGTINFYNLLAAHYQSFNGKKMSIVDFEIVNKGRFKSIGSNILSDGIFRYYFNENQLLSKVSRS